MKTSKVELYINGVLQSCVPVYSDKISIDKEREDNEMFRRTKLSSTLTFVGADFRAIYESGLDTKFEVRVYDEETNVFLARGTFEKTDCTFNIDDEKCDVKISSADDYDKIIKGKGNEYDVVALAPVREKIKLNKRAILQIYVFHDTKITNIIGNMSYEIDVASGVEVDELTTSDLTNTYNFSQVGAGGIEVFISNMPSSLASVEGTYIGNWNGTSTVLTQEGGTYKIVMGSRQMAGGTWWFWGIKDGNNNPVYIYSEGGNRLVTTQPLLSQLPAQSQLNTWGYEQRRSGSQAFVWQKSNDMVASVDEKTTFARVLLDYIPYDLAIGDVMKIAENDICATNLNYHYSMKATGISQLSSWIIKSTTVQDAPTKWGVNGDGKYFVQPAPMNTGDNVIPIGWSRWIPKSIWLNSTDGLSDILDLFDTEWELNDAYPLWSVIQVLLKEIDPEITFEGTSAYSQFLYGTISSSVILGWVKNLLYITPSTNIKKTYYNQAARKGKLTLEGIFEMLRNTCQLYWFIDSQKRLRIEHITWFKNGGTYAQASPLVDLTTIKSPMSRKSWDFTQNTIGFDKSALTKRYEFSWNGQVSEVFDGYPIDVHNRFVSGGKTYKASVGSFVSDIDLIMSTPDAVSDDTFALIGTDSNKRCPIQSIGNFGMDFVAPYFKMQNPYLSFYYLEMAYWAYDLGGNDATIGDFKTKAGEAGVLRVFDTKRAKIQSVKFPIIPSIVGKEGLIKTSIDNGEWIKAKYTPEDGMVEMDLVMATKDETLISVGEFVGEGVTMTNQGNGIIFSGNQEGYGYGYVRVTANKNVSVTMLASSEDNWDFGWEHTSPLKTRGNVNDYATRKVSGDGVSISFNMAEGTSMLFGYTKDTSQSLYGDSIIVTFVEQ